VLGSRDARFQVPQGHRRRLREGGKLAVTVEPAGGAPRGKATGPVILAGLSGPPPELLRPCPARPWSPAPAGSCSGRTRRGSG
jgi:hypothetical protein